MLSVPGRPPGRDQSTYQCKGADYRVTFYSHRTAPPATAATAATPLPREGPGPPDPMAPRPRRTSVGW